MRRPAVADRKRRKNDLEPAELSEEEKIAAAEQADYDPLRYIEEYGNEEEETILPVSCAGPGDEDEGEIPVPADENFVPKTIHETIAIDPSYFSEPGVIV
jgi:hypothetical protein